MYIDNLHALLAMGGHGAYVWSAYSVAVLVIVAMLVLPLRRRKRLLVQLGAEQRRIQSLSGGRGER